MTPISVIIIAVCLAMDAFGVSISNGMLIRSVTLKTALKFGLFFGFFQFIMPIIGYVGGVGLSAFFMRIENWVCLILLGTIGGKMIYESFRSDEKRDINDTHNITSLKNMTVLAVATSIDALAVGVTFALEGADILFASAVIGVVAFALSFAGVLIGGGMRIFSPKTAERIGGLILIGIGIKIFLGI